MSSAPGPPRIAAATHADVPLILALIRELADYERMSDQVLATEADIERALFGERPCAEAVIARVADEAVGFALFFQSFSTFVGRPGLYLEDLYVRPAHRGRGIGRRLLAHLARLAVDREAAAGSNGRCSTGTSWRSPRTGAPARRRWTSGRSTG